MKNSKFAGRVLLGIYAVLAIGVILWTVYDVYLGDYARAKTVLAAAGIVLAFIILFPKLKRKNSDSKQFVQVRGLENIVSVPFSRRMTAHLEIEASGSTFGFARHPRR